MSGNQRIVVIALLLSFAAYLAVQFGAEKLIKRSCVTFPVTAIKSPDGTRTAILEREHCTDDSTPKAVVWVESGSLSFPSRWSVFIARLPAMNASPESKIPYKIDLAWISDTQLDVAYPEGTPVESSAGSSNNVEVFYSAQKTRPNTSR